MRDKALEMMELIRRSGSCNMFDHRCVQEVAQAYKDMEIGDKHGLTEIINLDSEEYGQALNQFAEWKREK